MKKLLPLSIALVGLLYSACSNLAVEERSGFQGTGHITKSADDKGVSEFALSSADLDNYINYKKLLFKSKGENNKVKSVDPLEFDGDTLLYIFNFDNGWEIISADKRTTRVVSHCDIGNFSIDECIPAVRVWIEGIASDIKYIKSSPRILDAHIEEVAANLRFWDLLDGRIEGDGGLVGGNPHYLGHYELVDVIEYPEVYDSISHLITTRWHQETPYNNCCPLIPGSSRIHSVAGCVAIAGAQMLNYLNSHWSLSLAIPDSADCSGDANNWIPHFYNISSDTWSHIAVDSCKAAPLVFWIGTSVQTDYGTNGSSAYTADLQGFFRSHSIYCQYGAGLSPSALFANLHNGLPCIVQSTSILNSGDSATHTFIIDRFNWLRTVTQYCYEWVFDEVSTGILPYFPPTYSYSYDSPYYGEIGMNWGWNDPESDAMWFMPSGNWITEDDDESLNWIYDRRFLYNFSRIN